MTKGTMKQQQQNKDIHFVMFPKNNNKTRDYSFNNKKTNTIHLSSSEVSLRSNNNKSSTTASSSVQQQQSDCAVIADIHFDSDYSISKKAQERNTQLEIEFRPPTKTEESNKNPASNTNTTKSNNIKMVGTSATRGYYNRSRTMSAASSSGDSESRYVYKPAATATANTSARWGGSGYVELDHEQHWRNIGGGAGGAGGGMNSSRRDYYDAYMYERPLSSSHHNSNKKFVSHHHDDGIPSLHESSASENGSTSIESFSEEQFIPANEPYWWTHINNNERKQQYVIQEVPMHEDSKPKARPKVPEPVPPPPQPNNVTLQRSSQHNNNNNNDNTDYIEISPGIYERLRGAKETKNAILHDYYIPIYCVCCEETIFCITDANYVFCPTCRVVSPLITDDKNNLDSNDNNNNESGTGGVGLGFTMETLADLQNELRRS